MIDIKTLNRILRESLHAFADGRILDGIDDLRMLLPYCTEDATVGAEIMSIEENYNHMLSFLRDGGNDDGRHRVQEKIRLRGLTLTLQACRAIRLNIGEDHYGKTWRRLHDTYGTEARKAVFAKWQSLLTPEERCETQDDVFDILWTEPLWTKQDTAFWYDFITQQQDMVQQHLAGALFLAAWEYCDTEKACLLTLLAETECHRTHITAVTYLLLLRLRHKDLPILMPGLPGKLRTGKGRQLVAEVQQEVLLMLVAEEDMKAEMEETELLGNSLKTWETIDLDNVRAYAEIKARYLKNRLKRGLDPNLAKVSLLHSCKYLQRAAHWFLPLDKSHPLFQSVMVDEKGNEKQRLSLLVDLIMDCDVDKLATLYLISTDKDFSGVAQQLDSQELPDAESIIVPDYSVRYIVQDLYRFFLHSPLSSQVVNPFRAEQTLADIPELAPLFTADDRMRSCRLLHESGRNAQALEGIDKLIGQEGADAEKLLLKGQVQTSMECYPEAIASLQGADMLEPDNIDTLRLLSECYRQQERHEDEVETLQRLAALQPDDGSYRHLIAMAMTRAGRTEEALQLFFQLDYETEEDDALVIKSIACTAFALGRLDIAERYTRKELQLDESVTYLTYLRMGHIQLLQGHWKEGIDYYLKYVSDYCKENEETADQALILVREQLEALTARGVAKEDTRLVQDILQAATRGTL